MMFTFFAFIYNACYRILSKLAILENGGIHPKHRILDYHSYFLQNVSSFDRVIDIGCGKGELAYVLSKKVASIVAIDIKNTNIQQAKGRYQGKNLEFVCGDILGMQINTKFDCIVLSNVLEHIEERIDFLRRLHDVSDKIILRVPLLDRDWLTVYLKEKKVEYRLDPTHYIEYTLPILTSELGESGWVLDHHSIQFGELWGVLTSEK